MNSQLISYHLLTGRLEPHNLFYSCFMFILRIHLHYFLSHTVSFCFTFFFCTLCNDTGVDLISLYMCLMIIKAFYSIQLNQFLLFSTLFYSDIFNSTMFCSFPLRFHSVLLYFILLYSLQSLVFYSICIPLYPTLLNSTLLSSTLLYSTQLCSIPFYPTQLDLNVLNSSTLLYSTVPSLRGCRRLPGSPPVPHLLRGL